jgi:hypothetical protein
VSNWLKASVFALILMCVSAMAAGTDGERIVGRVGDVNVTADDLAKAKTPDQVFVRPAMTKYFESRKELITPTEEELKIVQENIRTKMRQMKAEGNHSMDNVDPEFIAKFLLAGWKYNTYLYDNFGGGRLLFQQAGVEAFDATHEFLKYLEKEGYFHIEDEEVRDSVFAYWTRDHGAFIMDNEEQVKKWRDIQNLGR